MEERREERQGGKVFIDEMSATRARLADRQQVK